MICLQILLESLILTSAGERFALRTNSLLQTVWAARSWGLLLLRKSVYKKNTDSDALARQGRYSETGGVGIC